MVIHTPKVRRQYGPSSANSPSQWKRCIVISFTVYMFVYLMAPGADEDSSKLQQTSSLRGKDTESKIPPMEPIPDAQQQIGPTGMSDDAATKQRANEEAERAAEAKVKLDAAIKNAIKDVGLSEEEDLQANQSLLAQGFKQVEDMFKVGLGKLFGSSLDDEEIVDIAEEVSQRLEEEVQEEFREKADEIATEKVKEIEDTADIDQEDRQEAESIRTDVKQVEQIVVATLKDEIDSAAQDIVDGLHEKALEIEKEVVNEHLVDKGIHVEVRDGKLKKDGDDDLTEETEPPVTVEGRHQSDVNQTDVVEAVKEVENTTAAVIQEEIIDKASEGTVKQVEGVMDANVTEVIAEDIGDKNENVTEVGTSEGGNENATETITEVKSGGDENATQVDTQEGVEIVEKITQVIIEEEVNKEENATTATQEGIGESKEAALEAIQGTKEGNETETN